MSLSVRSAGQRQLPQDRAGEGQRPSPLPFLRAVTICIALTLSCSQIWAALTIDATASGDGSTASSTIGTAAFSTASSNELLLAFVSTDYLSGANTTVTGVAGGGLTWVLVLRSNVQSGSSEIWRAFAANPLSGQTVTATLSHSVVASITVVSFVGADTTGTNGSGAIGAVAATNSKKGAPTGSVTTTRNGSWVFGVGNDYDYAIARTVGPNQSLIHQLLSTTGDTYWVQMQNSPTPLNGTVVTINDTAPAGDRYNLAIAEVLPSASGAPNSYTISGSISPAASGSGATVALLQNGTTVATATADGTGSFSFANEANGSYTVEPGKTGFTMSPTTQAVTVNGANVTGVSFTATAQTWSVSGAVSPAAAGIKVALAGAATATTSTNASGNYSFAGLANGSYTITPSQTGLAFTPPLLSATINGANLTGENFTSLAATTYSLSGTITPAAANIGVTLAGGASATTTTDPSGNYSFSGLSNGAYTVTPNQTGLVFNPTSLSVAISGANATGENFTSMTGGTAALTMDAKVSADTSAASAQIASPAFSTAIGQELLLAFISTDYLGGTNTTVTSVTGGGLTWTLVRRVNVQLGDAEIWRAFAASPLNEATVTAALSQKVVASITVVSFEGADATGTNGSGAIGATAAANASSGAPAATLTTVRNGSWVLGVGNDFDYAIPRSLPPGQSLIHQDLSPTGDTYWVQMQNAITPVAGTAVEINDTAPTADRYNLAIVEVLAGIGGVPTPPNVSLIAPVTNATVALKTTVAANASDPNYSIAGVQFMLDGANLGVEVTTAPYSFTWDTTTATAGQHTLSAIAYNSAGLSATSNQVTVTVDNSGNPALIGTWSSPVATPAVAVNLVLLNNNKVLFYQDGNTPTIWDYINGTFLTIPTGVDLFCSGGAALSDGTILLVGGYGGSGGPIGISSAEIFNPATNTFKTVPNMKYQRWYPAATPLSDGRVIVTAGWQTTDHTNAGIPEIYDPVANQWTQLTLANNPFETYPFILMLTDGRILHTGGSEYATDTEALNLTTQVWTSVDSRIIDGASATMYTPDKIVKAGSASDSQQVGPSSNTTFVLDMTQPTPLWQQTPPMAYARSFMNLTTLPDGTVLVTGGESDKNGGNIANAVYAAELWSPATQTWTTMSSMHTPREYHGTAVLLPDGRVMESGMGADFGNVPNELSAEFFSPPYLFKGARPTITQSPSSVQLGGSFFVGTPDAASITSAVLIRTGADTHFFDQNTRFVPVAFQQTTGGLTLTAPPDGYHAPPGYYMLFLVNASGVPSMAPYIQLTP